MLGSRKRGNQIAGCTEAYLLRIVLDLLLCRVLPHCSENCRKILHSDCACAGGRVQSQHSSEFVNPRECQRIC